MSPKTQKTKNPPTEARKLTLLEHIQELRLRILRAAIALFVGALTGTLLVEPVVKVLVHPLGEFNVIVLSPTEAPVIYFQIALFLGFILALPYILFQIYAFIAPGLLANERRALVLGIPASLALFATGGTFTLFGLIPLSIPVLQGFLGAIVQPTYSLEQYLSFVTLLVFWMGLLFQTPLVLYLLARVGFVHPDRLKAIRKIVLFGAALLAAAITPTTDPVVMILVTIPFVILYELGLILARLGYHQRTRKTAA